MTIDIKLEPGITIPTVHLNGTSKEELLQQLRVAAKAGDDFLDALNQAMPHDRDYYVQKDPHNGRVAREQMLVRAKLVRDMLDQLTVIARGIAVQSKTSPKIVGIYDSPPQCPACTGYGVHLIDGKDREYFRCQDCQICFSRSTT